MKFSIVTCTWNSAKTLSETIDSVQSQDYNNIEHIFVDGGSTDGTLEMIANRCPTATVLLDVSGGISKAMNKGIEAATGDVIAHLHSDDYFNAPNVVSDVAGRLEQGGAMWLYGRIDVARDGIVAGDGRPLGTFSRFGYASGAQSIAHPAVFVRAGAFRTAGLFDESLRYAMDIDLWLRLGWQFQPSVLDQVLTVFRDHPGSVSSANKLAARREEFAVRRRYAARDPLAFAIYVARYLRRTRRLRRHGV